MITILMTCYVVLYGLTAAALACHLFTRCLFSFLRYELERLSNLIEHERSNTDAAEEIEPDGRGCRRT